MANDVMEKNSLSSVDTGKVRFRVLFAGLIFVVLVLIGCASYFIDQEHQDAQAVRVATGFMTTTGTLKPTSEQQLRGWLEEMRDTYGASRSDARVAVIAIASMSGSAGALSERILKASAAQAVTQGKPIGSSTVEMVLLFNGNVLLLCSGGPPKVIASEMLDFCKVHGY